MSIGPDSGSFTLSHQAPGKKRILSVEDDPTVQFLIRTVLEKEYIVEIAGDGEEGLAMMKEMRPDLVLLDWMLPGLSGIEVLERAKQSHSLSHIPVIFVTSRNAVEDRIAGLNAGADDYICKPFEMNELLARVHVNLLRSERDLDANPLTRLPGNLAIYQQITRNLVAARPFAVCYLDIDRFKAYNDYYGFERGDHVIRDVADLLGEVAMDYGGPESFVGHIGGDDYLVITALDVADEVCAAAVEAFDARVPEWYRRQDRNRGHIVTVDRKGTEELVPLMTLSIGVVPCRHEMMRHPAQIGQIGSELKRLAKAQPGSLFVKDRRSQVPS